MKKKHPNERDENKKKKHPSEVDEKPNKKQELSKTEKLILNWRRSKAFKNKYERFIESLSTQLQATKQKKVLIRRMCMAVQTKFAGKVEQIANKYSKYLNLKDDTLEALRSRILMSGYRDVILDGFNELQEEIRIEVGEEEIRENINKIKDILEI